jgi:hypothetical protein
MKIIPTQNSFCVPLTYPQWECLNQQKTETGVRGEYQTELYSVIPNEEHPAIKRLMKAGCFNLEWNGHFGMKFYFTCYYEDIKKTHRAVTKFVESLK